MSKYDVAHIQRQGIDLIIIPLESAFDYKSPSEQNEVVNGLQYYAGSAGLRGTVVPVWQSGGRMKFIAPPNWHPFFRSLNWSFVRANINRELSIPD
ncbi:MAG TPA: hypothetical protein VM911_17980 [Pyrinomonadaceae bacterium]|jgi:hypothetical protein|nr:hypothetical protein [Pyrinomonadaceae bacterium]